MKHQRVDNVIYANFGKKTQEAPKVTSNDWLFNDLDVDSGRLKRGRAYARNGNVVDFEISKDRVLAHVAGSQNEPFNVNIVFPHRSTEDLGEVTQILLQTPGALRDARRGTLPQRLREILLAEDPTDIRFLCDCPDHATPCKHAIAVTDVLATRLESDPSAIFQLRGLNFAQIEQGMEEAAKEKPKDFWGSGELPPVPDPKKAPAIDDSDLDLLHAAMRSVSYTNIDQLRAVSDIEDMYDALTD